MNPILRILTLALLAPLALAAGPDLILHNAKVVTVDKPFSIHQAIAITDGKISAVGSDKDLLATRSEQTKLIDLAGKTVIPGLIDSHVHPGAAMTEFDHTLPEMESIADVLDYVKKRAAALGEGKWISLRQVFITRLRERRYPTRAELDAAAPKNPVIFSTGPDASLNSLALQLSGINKDFKITDGGSGFFEKDPVTGEPTGILRNMSRFVKTADPTKKPTEDDIYRRTVELFKDYSSVGITLIGDKGGNTASLDRYKKMRDVGQLPVRVAASWHVDTLGTLDSIRGRIKRVAEHPLRAEDPMLRIIGIKCYLDGGMLTGSAYMLEPWGVSDMYGITDPAYRGVLFIPPERLLPIVQACVDEGMQFTAHSVGDGAIRTLMDVYEQIDRKAPGTLAKTRPNLTHSNFMTPEDVARMPRLGVSADIQPIWLWLDAATLEKQFGYERLARFQPLRRIFEVGGITGGGSDHMQKIGSLRSINPYNPFLGMYVALTRNARWLDHPLHPEHALTREQVLRFYTINNAHILFRDHQLGSIEPGKFADLAVLDKDILTCPIEEVKDIQVQQTYLGGKLVWEKR